MQYWLEQALIDLVLGLIWSIPILLLLKQRNVVWWKLVLILRRLYDTKNPQIVQRLSGDALHIVSRLRPYNADTKQIEYCLGEIYSLSKMVYGENHEKTLYARKQLEEYRNVLSSAGEKKVFRLGMSRLGEGDMLG